MLGCQLHVSPSIHYVVIYSPKNVSCFKPEREIKWKFVSITQKNAVGPAISVVSVDFDQFSFVVKGLINKSISDGRIQLKSHNQSLVSPNWDAKCNIG